MDPQALAQFFAQYQGAQAPSFLQPAQQAMAGSFQQAAQMAQGMPQPSTASMYSAAQSAVGGGAPAPSGGGIFSKLYGAATPPAASSSETPVAPPPAWNSAENQQRVQALSLALKNPVAPMQQNVMRGAQPQMSPMTGLPGVGRQIQPAQSQIPMTQPMQQGAVRQLQPVPAPTPGPVRAPQTPQQAAAAQQASQAAFLAKRMGRPAPMPPSPSGFAAGMPKPAVAQASPHPNEMQNFMGGLPRS